MLDSLAGKDICSPEIDPDELIAELDALLENGGVPGLEPVLASTPDAPPAPQEDASAVDETRSPPAPGVRKKILLVEDNQDYREVVRYLLTQNSYEIIEAVNGSAGLSSALQFSPDLVLLDYHMPRMNGYEMLKELRAQPKTRAIPVIMFSGAANRNKLKSSFDEPVEFLEKPISNVRLLSAVAAALKQDTRSASFPAPEREASDEGLLGQGMNAESSFFSTKDDNREREEESGLEVLANDSPLINRVNEMLVRAVEMGASDIHIDPQERETLVRVRINGSLQEVAKLPASIHARLAARVKIMSNLVITERRLPQDGQIRAMIKGQKAEFRVSTLPSLHGEKIVLRVLGIGKIKASLSELGFYPRDLTCVEQALQNPHGLVLVTGPTGSGKSTTLYTMLRSVSHPDVNILTAEDPIEYELPGIVQVAVKPKIGLSFDAALRAFLRQDPDIMLVGEIRDTETAEIAVKASITGHLILSTLHTNSASATITRLTHMGIAPYQAASSIKLVVAQRLIKILCPQCKAPTPLSRQERDFLTEWESEELPQVFRGLGCKSCRQTGYAGRIPLFEVMPVNTAEMRGVILRNESADVINELAVREGMTSLRQAALRVVAAGQTSLTEAIRVMMRES